MHDIQNLLGLLVESSDGPFCEQCLGLFKVKFRVRSGSGLEF